MNLFVCENCNRVDSVELAYPAAAELPAAPTCTQCRGAWHGQFPLRLYDPDNDVVVNRPTGIGLG